MNTFLDLILARNFNTWNYAVAISDKARAVEATHAWILLQARTGQQCPLCRTEMSVEERSVNKFRFS